MPCAYAGVISRVGSHSELGLLTCWESPGNDVLREDGCSGNTASRMEAQAISAVVNQTLITFMHIVSGTTRGPSARAGEDITT